MGILSDLETCAPPRLSLSMDERVAELDLNDVGNARRILAVYGDALIFVTGRGWGVFDGRRFSFRDGDLVVEELAIELPAAIRDERDHARKDWNPPDWMIDARIYAAANPKRGKGCDLDRDEARDALRRDKAELLEAWAVKSGDRRRIKDALDLARTLVRKQHDELDGDPWALIVGNGQVDLRKVRDGAPAEDWLVPVDRSTFPTRCAGVEFDPCAEAPRWQAFLELILPDAEIRACAQRALGAILFGRNREQVALILRGPGGNGKSTLLQGLSHVLGSVDGYTAPCQVELLIRTRDKAQGAATPDEVDLPGARAYIASEPDERDVLSGKKIKNLTGGDRRMSRGNFAAFFPWTPNGIPILNCNAVPRIVDADDGLRQRLIFLPFDVPLREMPCRREQAEVVAELRAEGAGILNWLLAGLAEFLSRGIDPPAQMLELKTQIMAEADPVSLFLEEFTEKVSDRRILVPDFHKTFAHWCAEDGHRALSPTAVGRRMGQLNYSKTKSGRLRFWQGLAWNGDGEAWAAKATHHDCGSASRAPEKGDDDVPPF